MKLLPGETGILQAAETLLAACRAKNLTLATAESCTGGLIAAALTAIAGSSDVVQGGFVTYSNAMKTSALGVPADMITAHGAVSDAVACAMANGALARANADLAIAVTGVAGPGGGTPEKPVGLVWLALSCRAGVTAYRHVFPGDRQQVRAATVRTALGLLAEAIADAGRHEDGPREPGVVPPAPP